MTCVVGLVHAGRVYMGGDRAATSRDGSMSLWAESKVFRKSGYLLGFCGSFRAAQVLQYAIKPPPYKGPASGLTQHLATVFVDVLQQGLRDAGMELPIKGTSFLVGWHGVLHKVEHNFQIVRAYDGHAAVGCGEALALGALHVLAGFDIAPKRRVLLALGAAEHYNAAVSRPFDVFMTRPSKETKRC